MDYSFDNVSGGNIQAKARSALGYVKKHWYYFVIAIAVIIIISLSAALHSAKTEAVNASSTLRYIEKEGLAPARANSYYAQAIEPTATSGLVLGQNAAGVLADPTYNCSAGPALSSTDSFAWLGNEALADQAADRGNTAETAVGRRAIKTDAELTRKGAGY